MFGSFFSTLSLHNERLSVLQKGRKAAIAVAGAFIIGGAMLIVNTRVCRADASPTTSPSIARYDSVDNKSQASVAGTSTLHDWTAKSTIVNGNAQFIGEWKADAKPPIKLQSIDLTIPVNSLKSTEGGGMDDSTHDALKMKQFPNITYGFTKGSLKSSPTKDDPAYHFDTTGQLTVAGKAHEVNLDLAVRPHDKGQLTITTDVGMKMTDFGISPPTAMLGMIKSGDAITVKVTWELALKPPEAGK